MTADPQEVLRAKVALILPMLDHGARSDLLRQATEDLRTALNEAQDWAESEQASAERDAARFPRLGLEVYQHIRIMTGVVAGALKAETYEQLRTGGAAERLETMLEWARREERIKAVGVRDHLRNTVEFAHEIERMALPWLWVVLFTAGRIRRRKAVSLEARAPHIATFLGDTAEIFEKMAAEAWRMLSLEIRAEHLHLPDLFVEEWQRQNPDWPTRPTTETPKNEEKTT